MHEPVSAVPGQNRPSHLLSDKTLMLDSVLAISHLLTCKIFKLMYGN